MGKKSRSYSAKLDLNERTIHRQFQPKVGGRTRDSISIGEVRTQGHKIVGVRLHGETGGTAVEGTELRFSFIRKVKNCFRNRSKKLFKRL